MHLQTKKKCFLKIKTDFHCPFMLNIFFSLDLIIPLVFNSESKLLNYAIYFHPRLHFFRLFKQLISM